MSKVSRSLLASSCILSFGFLAFPPAAHADVQSDIQALEQRLDAQQRVIDSQQKTLDSQTKEIAKQKKQIDTLTSAEKKQQNANNAQENAAAKKPAPVQTAQNAPAPSNQAPSGQQQKPEAGVSSNTPPTAPVVEEAPRPQVDLLADQGGVLSHAGQLTYENTMEYTNTTRNVFAFNGVQLAQVVLVGGITANTTENQIVQESGRLRLGLTNRLEADIHVPYVYRNENLTNTVSSTGGASSTAIEGHDLGDIDAGLAYQLNKGESGWPFLIGNVRYKADNAPGPYDVAYNSSNNPVTLPTGTGFQTFEASVTAIKVSDPAVLFGNIGYVYDMSRDIDKTFNGTYVGHVSPGDAINALVGMSFAVNQDTSFSLGYKHSYVFPTLQNTIAGGTAQTLSSGTFQVGALTMGLSYVLSPKTTLNFNLEAGVTNDAPDVHLTLRIPFDLGNVF